MKKCIRICDILLGVLICALGITFIVHAVQIYTAGTESGAAAVYSAEIIREHLVRFAWLRYVTIIFAAVMLIVHAVMPGKSAATGHRSREHHACDRVLPKYVRIRRTILVIGVLLIILGYFNGGMRDVFAKAVMICTECVGLG